MSQTRTKPRFVNLQPTAVQVYDEGRHPVTVLPWGMRHKNPNGTYFVEGAHFQQFVSGRGPLYPFPADPNTPPGPLGETQDAREARMVAEANQRTQVEGLQASANRGRTHVASSVARDGLAESETPESFAARLRPRLLDAGITTARAFSQASRHELLKVDGITEANIIRARELVDLIYDDSPVPSDDDADPDAEFDAAVPDASSTPDPKSLSAGGKSKLPSTYSRKKVDGMTRKQLLHIIEVEHFDLQDVGTVAELRERVLTGLNQYEMLTD